MIIKVSLALVTVVLFISLIAISFNFGKRNEAVAVSAPTISPTPKDDSKPKDNAPTDKPQKDKPKSDKNQNELVVTDFKAQVMGNEIKLSWTHPVLSDISSLRIIRTSASSDGEGAVYNILNANGNFIDRNIKPSIRYYYEIEGKAGKVNIYSGIICAQIDGKIQLEVESNVMTVNGEKKFYEPSKKSKPYVGGDTVMIPLKPVAEALGGNVYCITENDSTNIKSAFLKFRKNEIELLAGKKSIIVNRKEKPINYVPVIKDGVLYASYSIISDYMDCTVKNANGVLIIDKPVNESSNNDSGKVYEQDINVMQDEDFEITLVDPYMDGKKWYYRLDNPDALFLKTKETNEEKGGINKSIFKFTAARNGEHKLIMKYFNPRLGEVYSEQTWIYTIKIKSKQ